MFYHPQTQRTIPEGTAFELDGLQYPSNWLNLSSADDKAAHGIFDLVTPAQPAFDPIQQLCYAGPIEEIDGVWTQTWVVADLPAETVLANQARQVEQMQQAITGAMDAMFDTTAKSKNYDNRITCALRAGYPGPFQAEGIAFASWMDAQNALAYQMLAEVQAGTRPMPATVDEALALLDPMVWPAA